MSAIEVDEEREGMPSASRLDRMFYCPGCLQMEKGLPDLPVDTVTDDGVIVHESKETGDEEGLTMTQLDIKRALDALESRVVDNWRADFNIAQESLKTFREVRFWIRGPQLDKEASAKPDLVVAELKTEQAFVGNYKTGFARLTPSHLSWQSRCEVIAVWQGLFSRSERAHIRGAFLGHRLATRFTATDYTFEDLQRVERELRQIVWRAQQPGAPRVPGSWCRWCNARGLCRENAAYAMLPHAGMAVTAEPDTFEICKAVGRMTPQEMGFVYERRSTVEKIFDALEARLKALPTEQLAQAGYQVTEGINQLEILDHALAFQRMGELLTKEERALTIKIIRSKAVDLLAAKRAISKKAADAIIIEAMGDAAVRKRGNPRLKPLPFLPTNHESNHIDVPGSQAGSLQHPPNQGG